MNTRIGIIVATFVLQWSSGAVADVIPPEVLSCNQHDAGAPCPVQSGGSTSGNCVPSTCSRLDYSQGVPPVGLTYYDCLRCTIGSASGGVGGVPNSPVVYSGSGGIGGVSNTTVVHSGGGGQQITQTGGSSSELDASVDHSGGQQNAEAGGASSASGGARTANEVGGGGESCSCLMVGSKAPNGLGVILLLGMSFVPLHRRRSRDQG